MTYRCPKGHDSIDSDYCSECGSLIGQSKVSKVETVSVTTGVQDICPDCGTPRAANARFCEVCRHDFQENKTGVAEVIVSSQQNVKVPSQEEVNLANNDVVPKVSVIADKDELAVSEKLNIVISVDKSKVASCDIQTAIRPDTTDRIFPLDLDENLIGRRSVSKGIYPEIEINDPGVSHRHLKFIKESSGCFAVLELGSANGTMLNGAALEPGIHTIVKAGDELTIGIWTQLKLVSR